METPAPYVGPTTTPSILSKGLGKAKELASAANQGLVNRGVTPLDAAIGGAGVVGAALLLKHLLTRREPDYVYR